MGHCILEHEMDRSTWNSLKSENVTDCILPQFVALSELLLEIDKGHEFYCGLRKGNE